MSYDIGDGYYVDDNGSIQQYASERTKDSDTVTYQTPGYTDTTSTDTSSGGFNLKNISDLLKGTSSYGMAGQLAGLGGIGALLNKMLGGSANGGYAGYQGGIPKYTAQRSQYALPVVPQTAQNQARVTDEGIKSVFGQEGYTPDRAARAMYKYGLSPERVANVMNIPVAQVQQQYHQALGPNQSLLGGMYGAYNEKTHPARGTNTGSTGMDYPYRRPGSGGITYFSPMQYIPASTTTNTATNTAANTAVVTPPTTTAVMPPVTGVEDTSYKVAAGGGLMYGSGGIASLGSYSDGGQLLRGPGDGVSDSIPANIGGHQPARLADGEFVVPARIVSELGNGSTEAGARKLYAMMDRIKATRAKAKNIAANTKADKHLPA
jgi:hypothetical protein